VNLYSFEQGIFVFCLWKDVLHLILFLSYEGIDRKDDFINEFESIYNPSALYFVRKPLRYNKNTFHNIKYC